MWALFLCSALYISVRHVTYNGANNTQQDIEYVAHTFSPPYVKIQEQVKIALVLPHNLANRFITQNRIQKITLLLIICKKYLEPQL
jgi:hypothetical protein